MSIVAKNHLVQAILTVDLKAQYALIKNEIDNGIREVMDSMAFINGPAVKSFQTEPSNYLGGAEVIACTNGTDALQIAMMALGLQPGDEVITANFTCVATAEIIALLQLKPVLVAVGPVTFNIDIEYILADISVATSPRALSGG